MAKFSPTANILNERIVARLRLRHLRLLACLEKCSTLSEAAREVGITQPAASQILSELENVLEVQLFERHARGLRATIAGQFLAQQSRQMLASVRYTAESLSVLSQGLHRPLQIGAIPSAIVGLIRPRLDQLRKQLKGVKILIQEDTPEVVMANLLNGHSQIALVRGSSIPRSVPLVFTELLSDDLIVIASTAHVFARRKSVALADLADTQWSMPLGTHATANAFAIACETAGFTPRHSEVQCMSSDLLQSITSDASTLAAVPRSLASMLIERGEVSEISLQNPIMLPPIGALHYGPDADSDIETTIEVLKTSVTSSATKH